VADCCSPKVGPVHGDDKERQREATSDERLGRANLDWNLLAVTGWRRAAACAGSQNIDARARPGLSVFGPCDLMCRDAGVPGLWWRRRVPGMTAGAARSHPDRQKAASTRTRHSPAASTVAQLCVCALCFLIWRTCVSVCRQSQSQSQSRSGGALLKKVAGARERGQSNEPECEGKRRGAPSSLVWMLGSFQPLAVPDNITLERAAALLGRCCALVAHAARLRLAFWGKSLAQQHLPPAAAAAASTPRTHHTPHPTQD